MLEAKTRLGLNTLLVWGEKGKTLRSEGVRSERRRLDVDMLLFPVF